MKQTFNTIKWGAIFLCFLWLSSCCTQRLYQAKKTFTEFEENYKKRQLDFPVKDSVSYKPDFRKAYKDVEAALRKENCLETESLLGAAYLIKGLCEFRLDKYEQAANSANIAVTKYQEMETQGVAFQKERKWFALALPYLIDIEQIGRNQADFYAPEDKNVDQAKTYHLANIFNPSDDKAKLEEAIEKLEDLKLSVDSSDPVMLAIVTAQLVGLKIWSDGLNSFWQSKKEGASMNGEEVFQYTDQEATEHLDQKKKVLLEEFSDLVTQEQADFWVPWWDRRI